VSEALANGNVAKQFPSLRQLRKYTIEEGKSMPKREAKQNKFLKAMLRELFTGRKRN